MERLLTSIMMSGVALMTMLPLISYANPEDENFEVSDIQISGCTDRTRSSSSRGLRITKEGDIVTCEINGIVANCGVDYFDVQPEYAKGEDAPDSLFIDVTPVFSSTKDCTCPYNVSFTIRNVKADSFYLYCWLYTGLVSFKETNQVSLEFSSELLSIDNYQYYIYKPGQQAKLYEITEVKGEVRIPSTVSYKGLEYTVTSFNPEGFNGREMTKLFFPKTIRSMGNDEFKNLFNSRQPLLESFEVEPDCPLLSSIDGVLYSSDHKTLYCLPAGKKLTEYTVADGVEKISIYAFGNCPNLKTIRLPESVTDIRPLAFYKCNNLEAIYISSGRLNRKNLYLAFMDMTSTPTLYVPESEVEYFKTIYNGPVLPISSSEALGIAEVNRSATNLSDSFDLQGRRLSGKPGKGVYVRDGKKRVVK